MFISNRGKCTKIYRPLIIPHSYVSAPVMTIYDIAEPTVAAVQAASDAADAVYKVSAPASSGICLGILISRSSGLSTVESRAEKSI